MSAPRLYIGCRASDCSVHSNIVAGRQEQQASRRELPAGDEKAEAVVVSDDVDQTPTVSAPQIIKQFKMDLKKVYTFSQAAKRIRQRGFGGIFYYSTGADGATKHILERPLKTKAPNWLLTKSSCKTWATTPTENRPYTTLCNASPAQPDGYVTIGAFYCFSNRHCIEGVSWTYANQDTEKATMYLVPVDGTDLSGKVFEIFSSESPPPQGALIVNERSKFGAMAAIEK